MTAINLVKQADLKNGSFPKNVRTIYKRGVMQFCKKDRAKLAKNWLSFEETSGTASSIQESQKTIRKVIPEGLTNTREAFMAEQNVAALLDAEASNEMSRSSKEGGQKHTLFIKNLCETVEEQDLMELF